MEDKKITMSLSTAIIIVLLIAILVVGLVLCYQNYTKVNDTEKVDVKRIRATGVPGVNVIDSENIQVIVGTNVQFVADELEEIVNQNR